MKLNNIFGKAVAVMAISSAVFTLGAVSVFALDATVDCTKVTFVSADGDTKTMNTNTDYESNGIIINANAFDKNKGLKYNKAGESPMGSLPTNHIEITADKGDTITLTVGQLGESWEIYKYNENGNYSAYIEKITFTEKNTSKSFKQITEDGTYMIVCSSTSTSNGFTSKIEVKSGTLPDPKKVSGTVVDNSTHKPTVKINGNTVTGNFELDLQPDSYAVSVDSDYVDVVITDKDGNVITSIDNSTADVDGLTITITDKKVSTVSGKVSSSLTTSGSVKFISNTTSLEYTGTIADGKYSVSLPQSDTYTVSLLDNAGYYSTQFVLATKTVTVGADEKTEFNLEAGKKISTWNLSNIGVSLPTSKIEKTTGTYKGIYVNASNGKFAPDSSNKRVQFNKDTVITIPDSYYDDASVTVGYSDKKTMTVTHSEAESGAENATGNNLTFGVDSTGNITVKATSNAYLYTSIKVEYSAPALEVTASGNTLSAKLVNLSKTNQITDITVDGESIENLKYSGTDDEGTAGDYSFTLNCTNAQKKDVDVVMVLSYTDGAKEYKFTVDADGNVQLK